MSKKVVCLALALVCFLVPSIGTGERLDLDLKTFSTNQLEELRNEISKELLSRRQIDYEVYYPGLYIVGEDIDPGAYLIQLDSIREYEFYLEIEIHASYESFVHYRETTEGYYLSRFYLRESGDSFYLQLKDKQLLWLDGNGTFRFIKLEK